MSVVKTVGRGVAWNTAATIFGKFLIFANVFLVLASFSVYEYGFSELIMSIVSVGSVALLPGLTSTIVADLAVERSRNDLSRMNGIFHQFFFFNFLAGASVWAVLFFGSTPIATFAGNAYAAQFLHIASFLFLITPLRTISIILATVNLRFFDQSFYGVIEEVLKLLIIVISVVWLSMGIHGLMFAIVLSQLFTVLLFAPRTYSAYAAFASAPAADRLHIWNLFGNHRKWSIGATYVGTFAQNLRIWIIKLMLGTEAVGLFAFAYGMFSHIASLLPLSSVLAPVIPQYVEKRDQLARILRASIKLQFAVAVVFLIGAWITSYAFIHILFPKYVPAIPLLYVLLLAILSNGIIALFTPVFAAFKEQQSFLLSNVFKAFLTAVILPVAIFATGTLGPALEVVLTTLINGIERFSRVKKLVPELSIEFTKLLHPDAYEREAMQTVRKNIRSRTPNFWPFTYI